MADLSFSQPERRSFLIPILLALAAVAIAIALAMHFFPATSIDIDHLHTDAVPTTTVYKSSGTIDKGSATRVIGVRDETHVLYIASKIRITNRMRVPIFLDGFSLTLTEPDNTALTVNGVEKTDLPDLQTNYPALRPLLTQPLLRNTEIAPGNSAEGTLLFAFNLPQNLWDGRQSAVVKVDVYHQHPVYATIPK